MKLKKGATQDEGVSEETTDQIREDMFPGNVRNSEMERIAMANDEEKAKEMGKTMEDLGYEPKEKPEKEEEPEKEETEVPEKEESKEEKKEEPQPEKPEEESKEEEMVKIKVDGEEREVPISSVMEQGVRALQKESTADKRLEEATRLLKEAKGIKPREESALSEGKEPEDETTLPEDDILDDEQRKVFVDLAHSIQYGDEDEAADALLELRRLLGPSKATQATGIKEDDVEEILNRREIRSKFNAPQDQGGFKDLMDDPDVKAVIIRRIDQALEDGKPNEWKTYETIGTEIRNKFFKITPTEEPKKDESKPEISQDLKDKKVIKQKIDSVTGVNAKLPSEQSSNEPQTEEEGRQEGVRSIMKSRNQLLT